MAIPSTEQLVLSVKQFLETDVIPKLEHRTAFHARIAANVLAIIARDIAGAPDTVERDILSRLLGQETDEAADKLCQKIRAGSIDETTPAVIDSLMQIARARVAADNPRYSTYQRLLVQESGTASSI